MGEACAFFFCCCYCVCKSLGSFLILGSDADLWLNRPGFCGITTHTVLTSEMVKELNSSGFFSLDKCKVFHVEYSPDVHDIFVIALQYYDCSY